MIGSGSSRFQAEVPIAISEGSKGTGKTLAARFFIEQKTWSTVVEALIDRSGAADATIIGVCASIQSSENLQSQVDASRTDVSKKLNLGQPANVYSTTSWLKSEMPKEKSEADWVSNWLDVIAWSAGFDAHVVGAGPRFLELLRASNQNAVAIIEGVEEIYSSVLNPGVGSMTRALLVGLPQRLRSEPKRPLGMVAFARRDTVEAAVSQNLDQFRREYASFALTWTDDDVLELAAWLVTQASAMPQLWSSDFGKLSQSEKASKLEQLWGRKLGPDDEPGKRIREAYTATWIVAVLSDLQGRLVPRDLIRLLANAAKEPLRSNEQEEYGGRLLIPRALKSAVEPTSTAKVRETEEEISELQQIFRKFRERAEQVAAPIDRDSLDLLGIKETEVDILRRHGIIFGDAPPYEVPELFRRGLSLRHAGARQSVVNLYRRARRKV